MTCPCGAPIESAGYTGHHWTAVCEADHTLVGPTNQGPWEYKQ